MWKKELFYIWMKISVIGTQWLIVKLSLIQESTEEETHFLLYNTRFRVIIQTQNLNESFFIYNYFL